MLLAFQKASKFNKVTLAESLGKGPVSRDFAHLTLKRTLRIFLENFDVILSARLRLPH